MDLPASLRELVTYGRVLGKSVSLPIRNYKVPRFVLQDRLFRILVPANEGRSRKLPKPHYPRSTHPLVRKFEAVVLEELPTASLVITLEWVACILAQTNGVTAEDFEVLLTLLSFLRRFCPKFSKERLDQARDEIETRQAAKRDFEAYSRAQLQSWEELAVAEAIRVGAIAPDLLEGNPTVEPVDAGEEESAEQTEQENQEAETRGPSADEVQLAHATADSLINGYTIAWDPILEHNFRPNFPNQYGKHDYIRSAAQLIEARNLNAARSAVFEGHTWNTHLSEEESELVVQVHEKICRGSAIQWCDFENRQGTDYPNNLGRAQLILRLAVRREEEWFDWFDTAPEN